MPLITIVLTVIVVGVLLWLYEAFIPGTAAIKRIVEGIVIVVLVIWLLNVFGLLALLQNVTIQHR